MKLPSHERRVFEVLAEESCEDTACWGFAGIMSRTGLDRTQVKRVCRKLAKRGFAKCHHGLWTEDGEPAGSGYAITTLGLAEAALERQAKINPEEAIKSLSNDLAQFTD